MKLEDPENFSWQTTARGFNKLEHVHLIFDDRKDMAFLMEFIEMFVENQNSLRKITLEFLDYHEHSTLIKLQSNVRFMECSKFINITLKRHFSYF